MLASTATVKGDLRVTAVSVVVRPLLVIVPMIVWQADVTKYVLK